MGFDAPKVSDQQKYLWNYRFHLKDPAPPSEANDPLMHQNHR
jgi:hypothetical protein